MAAIYPPSLDDAFTRANGAPGISPTGQVWVTTGGNLPTIVSNRLVNSSGAAGYAFVDMVVPPVRATWSFSFATAGTTGSELLAFLNTRDGYALTNLYHFYVTPTTWNLQLGTPPSFISASGTQTLTTPLAVDGTIYTISFYVEGDRTVITFPDGTSATVTHPLVSEYWGRYCAIETIWGAAEHQPRFESVLIESPTIPGYNARYAPANLGGVRTNITTSALTPGEDRTLRWWVKDLEKISVESFTNWTFGFYLMKNQNVARTETDTAKLLLTKTSASGITVAAPNIDVSIDPADTLTAIRAGTYFYELWRTDTDDVTRLAYGTITFID